MRLSVTKKGNEAKLTDLSARKCATIKQVLISKFAFGPKSNRAFRETGPSFKHAVPNILQKRNKKDSKTH